MEVEEILFSSGSKCQRYVNLLQIKSEFAALNETITFFFFAK